MKKMLFFKSRPVFRALLFCALTPLVGKAQDFHAYRDQNGDAYVQWDTTQGYSYTLQSSEDMEFWSTDSTWLGVGQTVSLLVQEAPVKWSMGEHRESQQSWFGEFSCGEGLRWCISWTRSGGCSLAFQVQFGD